MMERWVVKLIALILLSLTNIVFTLLPIKLSVIFTRQGFKGLRIISYMMCFGGGVFLSVFALHMAPDARELLQVVDMPKLIKFDLADMLMIIGFLMMLVLEKVVHRWYRKSSEKRDAEKACTEKVQRREVLKKHVCENNHTGQDNPRNREDVNEMVEIDDNKTCSKKICPKGSCSCSSNISTESSETDLEKSDQTKICNQMKGHQQNEITHNSYISGGLDPKITIEYNINSSKDEFGKETENWNSTGQKCLEEELQAGHHHAIELHGTRSLLLLLALSMHHVFEGISVGLKKDISSVWTLMVAIISHEVIISISLGLQLVKSYTSTCKIVVAGTLCSLMTPVGIAIGMAIVETGGEETVTLDVTNGVLQAISTGVFLYVTFFEILQGEITPEDDDLWKVFLVFLGYVGMLLLTFIPDDAEFENHGDNGTVMVTYNISQS